MNLVGYLLFACVCLTVIVQAVMLFRLKRRMGLVQRVLRFVPLRFFVTDRAGNLSIAGASAPLDAAAAGAAHIRNFPELDREKLVPMLRQVFQSDHGVKLEFNDEGRYASLVKLPGTGSEEQVLFCSLDMPPEFKRSDELDLLILEKQAVGRAMDIGVVETDPEGKIVFMNGAMCRICGYFSRDAQGLGLTDILNFTSGGFADDFISKVPVAPREGVITSREGDIRNVSYRVEPLHLGGRYAGALIFVTDRTAELRKEQEMRSNEDALEALAGLAQASYFRYSGKTGFITGGKLLPKLWAFSGSIPVRAEEWIYHEDFAGYQSLFADTLAGRSESMEYEFRSDYYDKMRYYRIKAVPEVLPSGERQLFGLIQDITDSGRKERELSDANVLIRSFFNAMPCLLMVKEVTDSYRYCLCNPEFYRVFGVSEADVVGKTNAETMPAHEAAVCDASDLQANRSPGAYSTEERVSCPDGRIHVFRMLKTAYNISGGRRMLFCIGWDISELEEARLREAEQLDMFRRILDSLPLMIGVREAEGDLRYRFWNRMAGELSGCPAPAVVGKASAELISDGAAPEFFRLGEEHGAPDAEFEIRKDLRLPDGGIAEMSIQSKYLKAEHGLPLQLFIGVDLTKRERVRREREALISKLNSHVIFERITNDCLRQVSAEPDFDRAVDGILRTIGVNLMADRCYVCELDSSGQYQSCRHEWSREGEASDTGVFETLRAPDFEPFFEMLRQSRSICIGDAGKLPPLFPDSYGILLKRRHVKSQLLAGIFRDGAMIGFCGLDFTAERKSFDGGIRDFLADAVSIYLLALERKQRMDEIASNDTVQMMTLDMMPLPLLLVDSDYRILHANPAAMALGGKETEDCVGKLCNTVICHRERPGEPAPCAVAMTLESGRPVSLEVAYKGRNYLATTLPIKRGGKVERVLECFSDVSEFAVSKKILERAAMQADAEAKAKSMFLATMSHELRTPLNSVIGFAELLEEDGSDPESVRESVRAIKVAGIALLNIINDILDLSKLDSGEMVLKPEPADIEELLSESLMLFEERLRGKGLYGNIEKTSELPQLFCDGQRLRQILYNLIGNAVKFTEHGGVTLTASYSGKDSEGLLTLEVRDTGVGIAPDQIEGIFEPFFQCTHNRSSMQGTGLGLPICRRLAQAMGGTLTVHSKIGEGSVFRLELPLSPSGDIAVSRVPEADGPLPAVEVLLVDDVPMNTRVIEVMCSKLGLICEKASSGKEALAVIEHRAPAVVFTDMWMPEMNGDELARRIRGSAAGKNIKVVLLSGDASGHERFDPGLFDAILTKPITMAALRSALYGILNRGGVK